MQFMDQDSFSDRPLGYRAYEDLIDEHVLKALDGQPSNLWTRKPHLNPKPAACTFRRLNILQEVRPEVADGLSGCCWSVGLGLGVLAF